MLKITRIRHAWPEPDKTIIDRPGGSKEYILLHYWDPVQIRLDQKTFLTRPNAFLVISPKTPQWFQVEGQLVHDWIHIEGEVGKLMSRFCLYPDRLYYPKDSVGITALVQELEKEITLRREYWESAIQARLELLLITVARSIAEETERVHVAAQTKAEFQKLRLKMMQSLEQKWDVERMAAEVAISPSWFFPLYRSVFGVSPNKDLILGRVEKAKQRLEGSDISIKELAEECGYTNEYHFIRQFRLVTGLTPKQYRITCRK